MARQKKKVEEKTEQAIEAKSEVVEETEVKAEAEQKDGETVKQTFTEEQVKEMINAAVAEATKKAVAETTAALAKNDAPQIIQVSADTEKVQFLWQAEVSDENIYEVGPQGAYGRIVGKTGTFYVPKNDLSRVMDSLFRLLMDKRWIIVVDGMTEDEREAYGVNYKDGEILDKLGFAKMVELGDKILEIYPKLCKGHREMVAKRFHEAYLNKSPYVTRQTVVELNRMSKELGSKDGDFTDLIEAMNKDDLN